MAKKQKTPTIKEQIYQSVANAQVKQALQNNGMAQFQDEYNAWQTNNNAANSDGFKAFQDEYDSWANAQVQTQTKASTQSMPAVTSVNPVKFKTAEERRAYKEKTTIKKPGSYDDSKSYANTFGKETSKGPSVGLQQIPKLNDYLAQIGAKDISNTDMDQVKNDLEAYEVEKAQRKASLEKAEAYLNPNRKLTKEEIKEARVLAGEGLMEFEGKRFKDLTPEEQREYNTYDDLATKISPLKTFFAGAGKGGLNTLQNIGNIIVTARQANAPTSAALDAQRQAAKDYRQGVKDYNQSTDSMISNAQTQNPVAYGAGQMSEKFLEYGLTNGLFETSALAKGGGKLATFAATQLGENAQDLVLDTLPLYMNIAEDQSLTDEQKADAILTNIRNNALGNAVAYGLLNYLPDKVGRLVRQGLDEKAANKAFADNISEGAEKLAKLNETGYVPPTKLQADEIAKLNENPLEADNAQFSALMNQFNNEFKDTSSMSAIFNPEDLNASMARQLTEALENNPKVTLPEVEAPKNVIDPVDKALADANIMKTHTPDEIVNMRNYVRSTNDNIVNFANSVKNDSSNTLKTLELSNDTDRAVNDIKRLTGIDTTGNKTVIDDKAIRHINNRHGINGAADHSMGDVNSLGRIEYVKDNYDELFLGKSSKYRLKDGTKAPTVVYVKKIDGQYYAVEAVTDTKAKTNYITSAFIGNADSIEKNIEKGSIHRAEDVLKNTPSYTSKNEVDFASFVNPKVTDSIPEVNENTVNTLKNINNPARMQKLSLPDDVSEKMASDLLEIRDASESMRVAAENIGTEQALAKYNRLTDAIENYERALYYSDDLTEVNNAKKATDAARQALYREIKKSNPNFKADLTGTKIGNAEYRRTSQVASEEAAREMGESIADADKEVNTNQWVRDAQPDSTNVFRGIEVDTKGPRPYAKKQGVSPTIENAAEEISKQMDNAAKTQQPIKGELEIKEIHDRKGKPRYYVAERVSENVTRPVESKRYKTIDAANEAVYRLKNANAKSNVPGADPLQFFGGGKPDDKWVISKYRTNTIENMGLGEHLPEKNFAYRRFSAAEQREVARLRNDSFKDLLNKETFDAPDIKATMEMQKQFNDSGEFRSLNRLAQKTQFQVSESGRVIQALAEYNKNTALGAIQDAISAQDETIVRPWKTRNKTKVATNSRIARALADLGNKDAYKTGSAVNLTHDQIKKGVIAEIEKEVGSVEKYFNDNDIEFLTQMAEDKSIPVWQITSEIEHKLKTGNWYTLDESIELPKPTNRKLQNALNSLVTETVRAEKETPSLNQIKEEVRNTLAKETADFEGQFTDDDIDYLANLIHEGASGQELSEMLNLKMATGSFGISDETLQQVNNIFKEISHYDENGKQFVEGQVEAYKLLANELLPNATPMEKFEAWRYLAMLGNPKTMLRNYIGNQTFGAVTGISNNIAAIAEAGVDKAVKALGGKGIQRTKSILNPITDSSLIKACAEDADASRYRQIVGSKYEKFDKDSLRKAKSVFNSKLAQFYEKLTDAGISDYKAVKNKFSTSLAGYLKANGKDTSIFKAEDELARLKELSKTNVLSSAERTEMNRLTQEVAELNKARDYALKQAEYATFHEDNKIASTLSKWSKTSREEGTGIGSVLIEGMIPFKKTPANVLRSGLEYSPFGAIDSIRRTGKLIYENTGKRANELADVYTKNKLFGGTKEVQRELAADVIESWSKTLTGTGLTALGFYLHNKGIIHSSDADTKYQDQLEGHQNYAIEINGKSYTIDWAAPAVMPLMVGAELSKLWSTTGKDTEALYNNVDAYVDAFNKLTDPLVETSMLSGVKDTLETAANYAKNNETINILPLLGYNLATGYMTQGIPTVGGQIARTIDPTRRSTYTDKTGVAGVLDKQVKKTTNKIPGLSTLNEPYVDTYGREQQNSPFNNPVGNLAYQMLSPGYLSNINETGADKVSREAYNVNKAEGALPKYQSSFKDAEGNRVSPSDYTTASRAYGQANFDIRQSLSEDEWFNNLDAAQKEEVVKKINSIAEHVGKAAIDPEYTTNSKGYNLYTEGGIPSLKEYFKEETDKSTAKGLLGDSGVRTNSNAGKAVVEAVSNGNMDEAKKLAEQAAKDKASGKTTTSSSASSSGNEQKDQFKADFGSNGSNVYKLYEKAKTIDPNTSAATYRGTYKRIDSLGDSNGSVNQKEFIQFLQDGDYTEAEAQKLAKMYGTWSTIPKLENGTWKFKKAK